jgi:hypothetical protein
VAGSALLVTPGLDGPDAHEALHTGLSHGSGTAFGPSFVAVEKSEDDTGNEEDESDPG